MEPNERFGLWIEALRSGRYEQCTDVMFDGERHCVFGVLLAAVYEEEFELGQSHHPLEGFGWMSSEGMVTEPASHRCREMNLDRPVTERDWLLACDLCAPEFGGYALVNRLQLLSDMNDLGVSFEDIADFMERCGWGSEGTEPTEIEDVTSDAPVRDTEDGEQEQAGRLGRALWKLSEEARNASQVLDWRAAEDKLDGEEEVNEVRATIRKIQVWSMQIDELLDEYEKQHG